MAQLVLAPTLSDIFTTLRTFLLGILPAGTVVVRGQVNRVPEPPQQNFIVMWPTRQSRIETNVSDSVDCLFTASIASTTMIVTDITIGALAPPAQLFGTGLVNGTATTMVLSQLSGSVGGTVGGTGTYLISPAQDMSSSPVSAGADFVTQAGEFVIQLDVHGPASAEYAQTITTLFRDAYAVETFAQLTELISPLYADDPKQIPFINAENQYEDRWVVEAHLQANQTLSVPAQYMDDVEVGLIDVDATFPPS